MERLNILSFGAGAIGTYVGGSLALANHQVVFVERPEVVDELRQRGLRLDLSLDRRRRSKERFVLGPSAFVAVPGLEQAFEYGPFDVALFALKSYDTAAALEGLLPFAEKMPPVLCLQNGVENEPAIEAALGADKVIPGTVTSSIGRRSAGDIVLEKLRGIGIAAGHPLAERLAAAFNEAYLNARLFPRAADMKWSKMLTNLLGNATSAILDLPPVRVFSHPGLYRLEMMQLREALAVMSAQGIEVVDLPGTPVRMLARLTSWPYILRPLAAAILGGGRGRKMPSLHIDLHAGRAKSEVNWLNGAVVRAGEKTGVATPVNRVLNETLLALTRGEMSLETYRGNPQALLGALSEYMPGF
jgi:2-dehydropantoate 2-reductase